MIFASDLFQILLYKSIFIKFSFISYLVLHKIFSLIYQEPGDQRNQPKKAGQGEHERRYRHKLVYFKTDNFSIDADL